MVSLSMIEVGINGLCKCRIGSGCPLGINQKDFPCEVEGLIKAGVEFTQAHRTRSAFSRPNCAVPEPPKPVKQQDPEAALHSARYILEEFVEPQGLLELRHMSGLPVGVIIAAMKQVFPDHDFDADRYRRILSHNADAKGDSQSPAKNQGRDKNHEPT